MPGDWMEKMWSHTFGDKVAGGRWESTPIYGRQVRAEKKSSIFFCMTKFAGNMISS